MVQGPQKSSPHYDEDRNSPLKKGRRLQANERIYGPNNPLFRQGERGKEMFILKSGEVAIISRLEGRDIELARLKAGSILGEMALLDNMPRSAFAIPVTETKATVINETIFQATTKLIPAWLNSVIKIITSRLRETNQNLGSTILKSPPKAIAHVILMEMGHHGAKDHLNYYDLRETTCFVTSLTKEEFNSHIKTLETLNLIEIQMEEGSKNIRVCDKEGLELFYEFKHLKEKNKSIPMVAIGQKGRKYLDLLAPLFEEKGTNTGSYFHIGTKSVQMHLSAFFPDFTMEQLSPVIASGLLEHKTSSEWSGKHFVYYPDRVERAKKAYSLAKTFSAVG